MGRSGIFLPRAVALARPLNCSVTKPTVGMPSSSRLALSWILHAVQEPQLPRPVTTASTLVASSSSAS